MAGLLTVGCFSIPTISIGTEKVEVDNEQQVSQEEEEASNYVHMTGEITEVKKDGSFSPSIVVEGLEEETETYFNIGGDFLLLDSEGDQSLMKEDLQIGQQVDVFYDRHKPIPMIYPAVIPPEMIVVHDEAKQTQVKVAPFDQDLLSLDGELQLHVEESTILENPQQEQLEKADLQEKELMVFYDRSTRSIPAQTTPNKVIALDPVDDVTETEQLQIDPEVNQLETENVKMDVRIPVINMLDGTQTWKQINETIQDDVTERRSQFLEQAQDAWRTATETDWDPPQMELNTDYQVTKNEQIVSVALETFSFTGGAGSMSYTDYYNIHIPSASILTLEDLFKQEVDYEQVVNENIQKQAEEQSNSYFDTESIKISDDQSFYIEHGNLVLAFGKYEIDAGAAGEPTFSIPLKQLEDLLSEDMVDEIWEDSWERETKQLSTDQGYTQIAYPQVNDMEDQELEQTINRAIEQHVTEFTTKDAYSHLDMDYQLSQVDDNYFSIVWKGNTHTEEQGEVFEQQSLTINQDTGESVTVVDLTDNQDLLSLLNEQVEQRELAPLPKDEIAMYFDEDDAVFYYHEQAQASEQLIEVRLPKDNVRSIIDM